MQRHPICEQLCRKIEAWHPDHPDALNLRGVCAAQTARPDEAIQLFKQAVSVAPARNEFRINLGDMYLQLKRHAEAAECYGQVIQQGKGSLPVQLRYCKALVETDRVEEAIVVLHQLKQQHPRNADVLLGLHFAYQALNRHQEARACLESVLEHEPEHAEALYELAVLDGQAGRFAEAEAGLRTRLASHPDDVRAYTALAAIKRFERDDDADLSAMTRLHAHGTTDPDARAKLGFMLGKAMEDLQQYDQAFAYFAEGNALTHQQRAYDADRERAHIQGITSTYTPAVLSRTSGLDDARPLFIIGMPRCGSTLVEQILAAHPDVESLGECNHLEAKALFAFHRDDAPLTLERLAAFTSEQWREVGHLYLEQLGDRPTSLRVTDKTLTNIYHAGAIHCALPRAKIVHVRRHPLDTCLSIYKHQLQGSMFAYGNDLATLGAHYHLYLQLMRHWREALPADTMLELDYENLIANQEEETRRLLAHCGLLWHERCLQFNKAKTVVRTASISQVRRPIYRDSIAIWRRYEKQLQPLIDTLGPQYSTEYRPGAC